MLSFLSFNSNMGFGFRASAAPSPKPLLRNAPVGSAELARAQTVSRSGLRKAPDVGRSTPPHAPQTSAQVSRGTQLFVSAFRFQGITYGAAGNGFAVHGFAPEDDFRVQLVFLGA